MLGFNHVLTGSIVAVIAPAPLVPFVALASHFLFDTFPHFGRSKTIYPYTGSFKRLLLADGIACIAGVSLAILLFPHLWLIILIGAFFGAAPDILWIWRNHGPRWFQSFLRFANWIQWGERPYGWVFDVIYGVVFVLILLLLANKL